MEDDGEDVAKMENAVQHTQRENEEAVQAAQRAQAEHEEMEMRVFKRAMQASRLERSGRA